jgi:hypothetical protein
MSTKPEGGCPTGSYWNAKKCVACASGQVWNGSKCVTPSIPDGKTYTSRGCPEGQVYAGKTQGCRKPNDATRVVYSRPPEDTGGSADAGGGGGGDAGGGGGGEQSWWDQDSPFGLAWKWVILILSVVIALCCVSASFGVLILVSKKKNK